VLGLLALLSACSL